MYGVIQKIIEDLIREKFGQEAWVAIKQEAGCLEVPDGGFISHEYYMDDITMNLVFAASKVAGIEVAAVLDTFGEYFVHWMMRHGYGSMLRAQGATMLDFLNSLDEMHRGLKQGMPQLRAPQFSCSFQSGALFLEYKSARDGLAPMIPGLVRGVGECLFSSRYSCIIVEEWKSSVDCLNHVRFEVGLEGSCESKPTHASSFTKQVAKLVVHDDASAGYAFFAQNPTMAHGWVQTLQHQVSALEKPEDVREFAKSFDLRHLASLLVTSSSEAEVALSTLFRAPFAHPGGLMPVPSLSYISGPDGVKGIRTAMVGSLVMCADVICGSGALVQTSAKPGYSLAAIKVMVCFVPNPLAKGTLLRAFADTPNDPLLESPEAWALVTAAWARVRPRFVLNLAADAIVLVVISCLLLNVYFANACWQLLALKCLFCKEVVEECAIAVGHIRSGWSKQYMSLHSLFNWISRGLFGYCLWLTALGNCTDGLRPGGVPVAMFAFCRWIHILCDLQVLVFFGPMILPITYTMRCILPFALVVSVVLCGFVYAYASLQHEELGVDTFDDVFRILFGVASDADIGLDKPGMVIWRYAFFSVSALLLMNLLIGVLSESYGMYQHSVGAIFNRYRAHCILNLEMCLLPRQRFSPHFRWLQALASIESPGTSNREAEVAPYLWLCAPETPNSGSDVISILKEHVSATSHALKQQVTEQTHGLDQRLQALEQTVQLLVAGCATTRTTETTGATEITGAMETTGARSSKRNL